MTGFDESLRSLLERAAAEVAPDPTRRSAAVERVTRRRVTRAWGIGVCATVVALAALTGGGALVPVLDRNERVEPAAHASPSPEWAPGVHPVLATGTHDGRSWVLHIVDVPERDDPVNVDPNAPEIVFEIEAPGPNVGAFETHRGWDVVQASFQGQIGGSGDYVMGMVDDDVASLTVVLRGAKPIEAPIFGHEEVRYFLAFVPRGARGLVVARSEEGDVLGSSALPAGKGGWDLAPCPRGDRSPGDDGFPVLGRGTFDGKEWVVSLIEDPDAAHPEDTESENPELLFEIEGPWPNAGAMETYIGWAGLSEAFYDRLDGGPTYAFGMASEAVASVTIEPDGGEPVAAELFDANGVPAPGSQVYVGFLPEGATGQVVARDASGATLGQEPLPALPGPPICEDE